MTPSSAVETLRSLVDAYAASTPVRRVAVVGNAPMPPDDARADAIDAADLVVRVNSFVLDTPGQPRAQGNRVDVVVWNRITRATPALFDRYPQRLFLLLEPMRMHGNPEMWPQSWPEDLGLVPVPNREVVQPLCRDLGIPWQEERLSPTTGTTAAWLPQVLYPDAEVLMTGFSFIDEPQQTEWRHQWGDACPVGREHRISAEAELVRAWVSQERVRLL